MSAADPAAGRRRRARPPGPRRLLALSAVFSLLPFLSSPAPAICPFSSPFWQGGLGGLPPGAIQAPVGVGVGGFWWELGNGDPGDGLGNDGDSSVTGYPVTAEAPWIDRSGGPPTVRWNWADGGVDGCLSGGAGAGVMVFYLLDSDDNYAVVAVSGTSSPIPSHDLDRVITGEGLNGNDVVLRPRTGGISPVLSNVTIAGNDVIADVAPAIEGMNVFFDAGGPYEDVVATEDLTLWSGGAPVACDPVTGCTGVTLSRRDDPVWSGTAGVIANRVPGEATCVGGLGDGFVCDPDDPAGFCPAFNGVCVPGDPITTTFGPPIPGGIPAGRDCRYGVGDTLSLTPQGSLVRLEWDAHPQAQGYQVFRCEAAAGPCPPQPLATTPDTFYLDDPSTLDPAWYRVAALGFPCPVGQYCDGFCWDDGVCASPPTGGCPGAPDLTAYCGCDATSYPNACQGAWAGAGVWFSGECP